MEIERRWLVDRWPDAAPAAVLHMDQGYFTTNPAIRIRREAPDGGEPAYVLCFKGGAGLVREEIEIPLDLDRYRRLLAMLGKPMIQKEQRRYPLPGGLTLEVNQVDPQLDTDFFYAEVEFSTEDAAIAWTPPAELAAYLSHEVTGQPGESMAAYWARTR
ncbi:hypothetical protein [Pseudoflavonifractor phocaeensis]|uniref:hypothetical protein n=1 Tax=Pseudoflavonifractor phocaeensis TaxID=1870988 RepID=UPI00195B31CA|nr:hypothetical protein [Pseudoflavonifractor phocaeensis]MBM6926879.1 hypothetical protein [Pseudoflavonifractor phocaeensis]